MIVTYRKYNSNKTQNFGSKKMNRARAVELSLVALKAYDQEDYVEQIYDIFDCICENREYEDDPSLTKHQMVTILENLTANSKHFAKHSLKSVLYSNSSEDEKKRVKGLLESILFTEDEDYY
tara:strand:- start:1309 stop:1674 length:366 start_codon:yes stop_codon:yes gene_type:complete